MVDDFETIPPPYSSDDPLRSLQYAGGETAHPTHTPRVNGDNRGISSKGYAVGEDEVSQTTSPVQDVEEHLAPQRQLGHGLISHTVYLSATSSSKATNHGDLHTLSESVAGMKLSSPSAITSDLQSKHPIAGVSLQDIKTNIITRLTSSTPPSHPLSRSDRRALKSELRALKHEIRAVVRQVRSERRAEARAKGRGRGCGKALSCQEKRELRSWKRESLKEEREVKRVVSRAGRSCV
jgi:hypothetical protein